MPAECRICFAEEDVDSLALIAPCQCSGSIKWVHRECLDRSMQFNDNNKTCLVCNTKFAAKWKGLRPVSEWTLPPTLDHYDALHRATFGLGVVVAIFFISLTATRIYSFIRSFLNGDCGLMNVIVGIVLEVGLAASRCVPLRSMGIRLQHFHVGSWLAAVSAYEWVDKE